MCVQSNLPYPGSVNSDSAHNQEMGNTVHCTMPMGKENLYSSPSHSPVKLLQSLLNYCAT